MEVALGALPPRSLEGAVVTRGSSPSGVLLRHSGGGHPSQSPTPPASPSPEALRQTLLSFVTGHEKKAL